MRIMTGRRFVFSVVVAMLGGSPAHALPFVEVETNWAGVHEDMASSSPPGPVVSGTAYSDAEGGNHSEINNTALPSCPGTSCGTLLPGTGAAFARAEANGNSGALRARAAAFGGSSAVSQLEGFAIATAALTDTISFQGSTVVHFDFDLQATLNGFGGTEVVIRFGLPGDPASCAGILDCIDTGTVLAELVAGQGDNLNDGYTETYTLTVRNQVVATSDNIPGSVQFDVDLATEALLADLFNNGLLDIFVELRVAASSIESGTAVVAADNSLYVQIDDVTSENGYSYPGRLTTNPGGDVTIPEPATFVLFATGLIGFGLSRRRRAA